MAIPYLGALEERYFKQFLESNPTLRDAMDKLLESKPFDLLTEDDRDLLHSIGLSNIMCSTPEMQVEEIYHKPDIFISFMYELDSSEYIKLVRILDVIENVAEGIREMMKYHRRIKRNYIHCIYIPENFSGETRPRRYNLKPEYQDGLKYISDFFKNNSIGLCNAAVVASYSKQGTYFTEISDDMVKLRVNNYTFSLFMEIEEV